MGKFLHFLYITFWGQEKNRRDILDYLRGIIVITLFILMVWVVMYYGLKWR